MEKEKKVKKQIKPFVLKKEAKLLPGYIFVGLWVAFTAVILIWILGASLSTARDIYSGSVFKFTTGVHFKNYISAWKSQNIAVFFANSLLYATTSCAFTLLISAPAAYVLSRFIFPGSKLIKSGLLTAMSVPVIMVILPVFSLTSAMNVNDSRWLLIVLYTFLNVPFTTIFLLNFFGTLSPTFEEAAAIDGCSPMKTFWKIMLPLAQPGMITVAIFNFLNVWNEYFLALIFAGSNEMKNVGVGLFAMVNSMKATGNLGGLFAAVVIVFLPTFLIYVFMSEKIIAGVTGGGIKG
ncbi:MAG: carbohydrate ABC transporter permease [Oscillospiraceae bacterium]